MDFGKWIFEERQKQSVSRYALSKRSGVPESTIANWEVYGIVPTIPNLTKALQILGYELKIEKIE